MSFVYRSFLSNEQLDAVAGVINPRVDKEYVKVWGNVTEGPTSHWAYRGPYGCLITVVVGCNADITVRGESKRNVRFELRRLHLRGEIGTQ